MAITRASIAKQLEDGLNAVFGENYRNLPEEWPDVFERVTSSRAWEEEQLMTGFGAAVEKPEGGSVTYDNASEGWTSRYTHVTTALAVAITEEAIEDNRYGQLVPRFGKGLARSMKHTTELRAASVLNNCESGSYLGGDGKSLLATDHPQMGGGTWSNKLAIAADPSEAALEDLLIMIRTAKDDRGLPIALKPLRIITSPYQEYAFERILRSSLRPGTTDNDVNAINSKSIFRNDPAIITRLSDPDMWFVKTDCPDGLKCFVRRNTRTKMEDEFNTGNMRYKVDRRDSFGWTDPRALYGSSGA